jgi:hypothetical protein
VLGRLRLRHGYLKQPARLQALIFRDSLMAEARSRFCSDPTKKRNPRVLHQLIFFSRNAYVTMKNLIIATIQTFHPSSFDVPSLLRTCRCNSCLLPFDRVLDWTPIPGLGKPLTFENAVPRLTFTRTEWRSVGRFETAKVLVADQAPIEFAEEMERFVVFDACFAQPRRRFF